MFGKMKDRAAGAAAAGMAAASQAATKAAKTAKYGVAVARDAAFGSGEKPLPPRSPQGSGGGYAPRYDEDDEEMELQRALAASMKTAAQERTRGAEAPRFSASQASQVPRNPPGLEMLMEMGFEESLVRIALQASDGDVEAALAQLCANREDLEGAASDGSSVGTPTHGAAQRCTALEAAEKRAAEARNNAGTMDDWRQEQRRQASRAPEPPPSERPAQAPAQAPRPPARDDADPEDWMLQQALSASLETPQKTEAEAQDPELLDLQLRQAMPEEELDLQMALSASLHAQAHEADDPSCAGAAVGEEAEQEEERARLSASAQHHLSQEQEKLPEDEVKKEAVAEALPRPAASPTKEGVSAPS